MSHACATSIAPYIHPEFVLRDYQIDCIASLEAAAKSLIQRPLLVLATGSGKTVILVAYALLRADKGRRVLILAHREELTSQILRTIDLLNTNPLLVYGEERAESRAPRVAAIVVGSVPTLARNNCKRLRELLAYGDFLVIITDEAHHSTADSNLNIYRELGFILNGKEVRCPEGKELIGVTATPKRTDGVGLEAVYQSVVFQKDIREMIEDGWLVDIVTDKITSDTSLDGIHSYMGDYKESELAQRLNTAKRNALIVRGYLDNVNGKKAIAFCIDVQHTTDITALFQANSVAAEMIVGSTPTDERKAILKRFKTGETKVLCGCKVFTEGFDEPTIEVVILGRPTKSQLSFIQMIGRGTRAIIDLSRYSTPVERIRAILESSKPVMRLLDIVDNSSKNSAILLPSIFGLPKKINLRGKGVVHAVREVEQALHNSPNLNLEQLTDIEFLKDPEKLKQLQVTARRVDIFQNIDVPDEIKQHSEFRWVLWSDGSYRISPKQEWSLIIRQNLLAKWDAVREDRFAATLQGMRRLNTPLRKLLGTEATIDALFQRADKYIKQHAADAVKLLSSTEAWLNHPPTPSQLGLLSRNPQLKDKIRRARKGGYEINKGRGKSGGWVPLTKGIASSLISQIKGQ